jgi:hypothetical protein
MFEFPTPDIAALQLEAVPDDLKAIVQVMDKALLRHTLQAEWDLVDAALAA